MTTHERIMQEMYSSSMERTIKRLWITIMLLIVLLVGTNVAWIIYESQYEDVTQTIEATQGDGTNVVSGGDINYGTEGQNNN